MQSMVKLSRETLGCMLDSSGRIKLPLALEKIENFWLYVSAGFSLHITRF